MDDEEARLRAAFHEACFQVTRASRELREMGRCEQAAKMALASVIVERVWAAHPRWKRGGKTAEQRVQRLVRSELDELHRREKDDARSRYSREQPVVEAGLCTPPEIADA